MKKLASLHDYVNTQRRIETGKPPLTSSEIYEIIKDIAKEIANSHEKGVIYQDLRSTGVLLEHTEGKLQPTITKTSKTKKGDAIQWLAPELLLFPDKKCTIRGDVYSFGMIILEMLTGKSPLELIPEKINNKKDLYNYFYKGGKIPIPQGLGKEYTYLLNWCTDGILFKRPDMKEVINFLENHEKNMKEVIIKHQQLDTTKISNNSQPSRNPATNSYKYEEIAQFAKDFKKLTSSIPNKFNEKIAENLTTIVNKLTSYSENELNYMTQPQLYRIGTMMNAIVQIMRKNPEYLSPLKYKEPVKELCNKLNKLCEGEDTKIIKCFYEEYIFHRILLGNVNDSEFEPLTQLMENEDNYNHSALEIIYEFTRYSLANTGQNDDTRNRGKLLSKIEMFNMRQLDKQPQNNHISNFENMGLTSGVPTFIGTNPFEENNNQEQQNPPRPMGILTQGVPTFHGAFSDLNNHQKQPMIQPQLNEQQKIALVNIEARLQEFSTYKYERQDLYQLQPYSFILNTITNDEKDFSSHAQKLYTDILEKIVEKQLELLRKDMVNEKSSGFFNSITSIPHYITSSNPIGEIKKNFSAWRNKVNNIIKYMQEDRKIEPEGLKKYKAHFLLRIYNLCKENTEAGKIKPQTNRGNFREASKKISEEIYCDTHKNGVLSRIRNIDTKLEIYFNNNKMHKGQQVDDVFEIKQSLSSNNNFVL